MTEHLDQKEKLLECLEELASRIGPRPAGSSAERRAFDFISRKMQDYGYQVSESKVEFPQPKDFVPVYPIGSLLLLLAAVLMQTLGWIGLLLPILGMALPQLYQWWIYRQEPNSETVNLFASLPSAPKQTHSVKPVLLLSAHVDSGIASPYSHPILQWFNGHTLDIFQRTAFFAAIVSAFLVIGFPIPMLLINLVRAAALFTAGWIIFDVVFRQMRPLQYSPGANDNASGVAACLFIAEQIALFPPSRLEVQFLFTGAEETGLNGARTYAEKIGRMDKKPKVIVLDSIGCGEKLAVARLDGTIIRKATSAVLNNLIWTVVPEAGSYWFTHKSADHLPFLQQKIEATTLISQSRKQGQMPDHTMADTVEAINLNALLDHSQNIIKVIEYANSSLLLHK